MKTLPFLVGNIFVISIVLPLVVSNQMALFCLFVFLIKEILDEEHSLHKGFQFFHNLLPSREASAVVRVTEQRKLSV